ncbi:MAG: Fe(3+) ABC transporter substrate-binding protein [Gammaproteobacteria bacterium]|jgi:iron(III) transport system substrate-binding protein|nr:Fe(3+) ABC transporter substrate-binding protein [Candidatus Neomarinimicrobiota bacterium]MBT6553163.1 Fe(3+) ABC transporter substrate-binding protein [Gammaproteobacteria bacterium]MBT7200509.1 Fe(3+) ABC transporter substrate-binding protein [Candidatus Neomarinimicrobiota bacterium]
MKLKHLAVMVLFFMSVNALASEVNVYSGRKEKLIKPLLDRFTAETGIKTNLVTAKADKLLTRLKNEGRNTPADVFITVDAGRLYRAKQAGVLASVESLALNSAVPAHLRDPEGQWVGLSQRARVIFYAKDRVKPEQLSTYEDLASDKWKRKICIRGSGNIYNQSLVASLIASNGKDEAQQWSNKLVKNMARPPKGGDRDQIKAAAAGQCDIAIANTYYYGSMLTNKKDPSQVKAAESMAVFWPNQQSRGSHVNISGAGITKYAKNPVNALKLLEFLVNPESQKWYAEVNFEYPVSETAEISELVKSWGSFKSDKLNLDILGRNNAEAVRTMDRAGWK